MRTRESVSDTILPLLEEKWGIRTVFQRSEVGARGFHTYVTSAGELWGDLDAALAASQQVPWLMHVDNATYGELVAKQINAWLDSGFLKKLEGESAFLY